MKVIAYCTKGLESVVAREIENNIPDAKISEVSSKRILFESNADFGTLTLLKTVDDIGLFIKRIEHVQHFNMLIMDILTIDFQEQKQTLQKYRKIYDSTFSLTVGSVGVKNFTTASIKQFLSKEIARRYQWQYTEMNHTNFDIRVFIDHNTAYVSLRLTHESLYARLYKQQAKPGSLKPTVAAAMVMLAADVGTQSIVPLPVCNDGLKVIDSFCGSGTILCESFSLKCHVYGGDIDHKSVLITKNNLKNLGFINQDCIQQLDAAHTNWSNHFFDCAISNLPWDKQVPVKSITNLYSGCLNEYRRIVKKDGVICVLVTKPDLLLKHAKSTFPNATIQTIPISFKGQQPTIILIKRRLLKLAD